MKEAKTLNIFYEEPEADRWIKYDRYPRKLIRRIVRGPEPIGGVKLWFVNLIKGLDLLQYPYEINNYSKLRRMRDEWALVIGKAHVIKKIPHHTRIVFGPGISSHPLDDDFWVENTNIKHLIVSCEWMRSMYHRDLPISVPISVWPSGIDTHLWAPNPEKIYSNSFLIYDKIRWDRDKYASPLLKVIKDDLKRRGANIDYIQYGAYKETDFQSILKKTDAMIFLCEHETQGFAYLQTLSCDVPIMAWDRGGYWRDPALYPDKVRFGPVTSVPYWSDKCGEKFTNVGDFGLRFETFSNNVKQGIYSPREYILNNFNLASRSNEYVNLVSKIMEGSIENLLT